MQPEADQSGGEVMTSPFAGRDVSWLLTDRVSRHPDKEFLVWRGPGPRRTWTYAGFADEVERMAAALHGRGVRASDAVCVHAQNCPEYLCAWFALARLGAIMVATNVRNSADELRYCLERSGSRVVCTQQELLPVVERAVPPAGLDLVIVMDGSGESSAMPTAPLTELLAASWPAPPAERVSPAAPAGLQFTSGTTSRPKGVIWTQANYLWGAKVNCGHAELRADDRFLVYLPLFHANAQIYCIMPTLWAGGTVILMPGFSASRFWPVAVEERATWCSMIPFTTRILLSQPVPDDHCFRAWGVPAAQRAINERFGVDTISWWGMTETVSQPVVSEIGGALADGAIGYPAPEYRVRVIADDGTPVTGAGEGLLEVLGDPGLSLMSGYYGDPEATRGTFTADGWLQTFDRVAVDKSGVISFRGRAKDMLKIGGENVAATEIERVIGSVPGVREVAVVAASHPLLVEMPVAFVVAEAGSPDGLADPVLATCADQLASFKVPHSVLIVDDLPRAVLGKVAKNVLRDRATAALLEQAAP
jgi:crotonobetaine/carnitine-CoA ligase